MPSELPAELVHHYAAGAERDRLAGASSEELRTQELLARLLPPAPARVLDVSGGAGVHAAWPADRGYGVHLIDPVPLHVEQAREAAASRPRSFTAAPGDARALTEPDRSCDAVLLLGPGPDR